MKETFPQKLFRNTVLCSQIAYIVLSCALATVHLDHAFFLGEQHPASASDVTFDFVRNNPVLSWVYDHPFKTFVIDAAFLACALVPIGRSRESKSN